MVNTLLNIENMGMSVWRLKRILTPLMEVENMMRLNPSPSVELQSKEFVDKDIMTIQESVKKLQGEIAIATKEWEVVDSFIEIYDLEAHTIYHKLTGDKFPPNSFGYIAYNTKKGLKGIEKNLENTQATINKLLQDRKEYQDSDDSVGGGFGYKGEKYLDQEERKYSEHLKVKQDAYKEWNDIKEAIKQQELTADKYLSIIKELIAEQTPKI
jgi:hypothetical protein